MKNVNNGAFPSIFGEEQWKTVQQLFADFHLLCNITYTTWGKYKFLFDLSVYADLHCLSNFIKLVGGVCIYIKCMKQDIWNYEARKNDNSKYVLYFIFLKNQLDEFHDVVT